MKLTEAIAVARRVMIEHAGIEVSTIEMRPHAQPVNPDNLQQTEAAAAYNAMYAFTSMLNTIAPESV
jgi:hypothetical protein